MTVHRTSVCHSRHDPQLQCLSTRLRYGCQLGRRWRPSLTFLASELLPESVARSFFSWLGFHPSGRSFSNSVHCGPAEGPGRGSEAYRRPHSECRQPHWIDQNLSCSRSGWVVGEGGGGPEIGWFVFSIPASTDLSAPSQIVIIRLRRRHSVACISPLYGKKTR